MGLHSAYSAVRQPVCYLFDPIERSANRAVAIWLHYKHHFDLRNNHPVTKAH